VFTRSATRVWPNEPEVRERLLVERRDLVDESVAEATGEVTRFEQANGPFREYRRTVTIRDDEIVEATSYRLRIPWFGWLFALPVWAHLARRGTDVARPARSKPPWWAPPDRIDERQALVLGLLAAASMSSAFTNTLFTQTAQFAADDFGVGDVGFSIAGAVVRAGIVVAVPFAVLADLKVTRRKS